MSRRLGQSINRILAWARGHAADRAVRAQAKARLQAVLTRYYTLLLDYTVRTRIRPHIGHPIPLTAEDETVLHTLITTKLVEFDRLLDDALRG